jgi:hypothetical protein
MAFGVQRLARLSLAIVLVALSAHAQDHCACGPRTSPCGNMQPGPLQAGCVNSLGLRAYVGPIGTTSLSTDDLVLSAFNMPPAVQTFLLYGAGGNRWPFGDGVLCVSAGSKGMYRFPLQISTVVGTATSGPGLAAQITASFPASGWLQPGDTWYFQRWYRDAEGPCGSGFNLTNGLGLTFTP